MGKIRFYPDGHLPSKKEVHEKMHEVAQVITDHLESKYDVEGPFFMQTMMTALLFAAFEGAKTDGCSPETAIRFGLAIASFVYEGDAEIEVETSYSQHPGFLN